MDETTDRKWWDELARHWKEAGIEIPFSHRPPYAEDGAGWSTAAAAAKSAN